MTDFFADVPAIGGPGMGMDDTWFVLDPVTIAKAGRAIGADDFDDKGPGIRRIIVGGEIGDC